ncbi:MAG TPA: prolyl oligopeptidase family serine peptidase, partial [Gemmatimonas sp.]|uniref:S9 family peptidase n=1 Tax=Gemmatimonas sp. TaxID=1962908 RepID=UPI002ED95D23
MTMFRILCGTQVLCALLLAPRAVSAQAAQSLRTAAIAERELPRAPRLPRTAFLENRTLVAAELSPAGDAVAYLREQKDSRALWLLPAGGGDARMLVGSTQADQVMWSRDGRWLFLRASRVLTIVGTDGRTGVRVPLGGSERRRVIKLDPSQPAAVLLGERVAAGKGERWRVVRMDAQGKRTVLREDARWIHDVAFDAQGRVVALTRFEGAFDALYRVRGDGSIREALRLQPMQRLNLLTVRADGSLLMTGNAGDGSDGKFRRVLRLDTNNTLQTLHHDPRGEADLDGVVVDPRTQEPLAASYRSTIAATYGIDDAQAIVTAIAKKFPGRDIDLQAGNGPSAHWLVSERAPTLRDARWYLYDSRTGNLRRILDDPGITAGSPPETALARKLAIAYTASDGTRVHGFVLLPPGVDAARAPLITHVHGGPANHFRAGYDGTAQFLANRGYVVFQSNFRGSTGHGLAYTFAPNGDYGNGRVQQDIVEGVRWLL